MIYTSLFHLFSSTFSQRMLTKPVPNYYKRTIFIVTLAACDASLLLVHEIGEFDSLTVKLIVLFLTVAIFIYGIIILRKNREAVMKFYSKYYDLTDLTGYNEREIIRRIEYYRLKEALGKEKAGNLKYVQNLLENAKERAEESKFNPKLNVVWILPVSLIVVGQFLPYLYKTNKGSMDFNTAWATTIGLLVIVFGIAIIAYILRIGFLTFTNTKYLRHMDLYRLLKDLETEILLNNGLLNY